MHKYQPRIHVIKTNDFSQIPWAPQQAFVFPETEFVAVTAYQVTIAPTNINHTSYLLQNNSMLTKLLLKL